MIPLPFESVWNSETTRKALYTFISQLFWYAEDMLHRMENQNRCIAPGKCSFDDRPASTVYDMIKKRYLEDYLVSKCDEKRTSMEESVINFMSPEILQKYNDRIEEIINSFEQLYSVIPHSDSNVKHRSYIVRTKILDYAEDLFTYFCGNDVVSVFIT